MCRVHVVALRLVTLWVVALGVLVATLVINVPPPKHAVHEKTFKGKEEAAALEQVTLYPRM